MRRYLLSYTIRILICFFAGGLLLAACGKEEPAPPSRNVFYEVQTVSRVGDRMAPSPTGVAASSLSISVADKPILSPSLEAQWSINWLCLSDRCQFETCVGTAHSRVRDKIGERWLEIDRRVDWNEGCGKQTSWLSQVDQFTGEERYPSSQDRLFNFWAGAKAGAAQRRIQLQDGRAVDAWCTGPQQAEVAEADGWTTLYDGEVCYDVQTGMLVFMSYIKRWVFTGSFQGSDYERAYFGDSETYEQLLETTNAELSFADEQ
ncbi:MAG: hypothetical protein KF753_23065 [Caldilineaceae bacterium]|nr:hypothetical protein [Caldilineaceae bacterium]